MQPMPGGRDLTSLIADLRPLLRAGAYVFCTIPDGAYGDHAGLSPFAAIAEPEGLTLLLERERADQAGLEYHGVFALLTLQVHSSLEAVGLTAAVAARLTELGISANVLAGYFHDHVLVPLERAEEAVAALRTLGREARE